MNGVSFIRPLAIHFIPALGHQLAELVKSGFLADYLREPQGDRASGSQTGEQQHEVPNADDRWRLLWWGMHSFTKKEIYSIGDGGRCSE